MQGKRLCVRQRPQCKDSQCKAKYSQCKTKTPSAKALSARQKTLSVRQRPQCKAKTPSARQKTLSVRQRLKTLEHGKDSPVQAKDSPVHGKDYQGNAKYYESNCESFFHALKDIDESGKPLNFETVEDLCFIKYNGPNPLKAKTLIRGALNRHFDKKPWHFLTESKKLFISPCVSGQLQEANQSFSLFD